MLATANPIGSVVAHAAMHTTAVAHSYETDVFLPPEKGPTQDTPLQWATYYDAADQAGISRLWSGIHVRADDFEGRKIGAVVGVDAYAKALTYFDGTAVP